MNIKTFDHSVESSMALAGLLSKAWKDTSELLEEHFEDTDTSFDGVAPI